MIKINFKIMFLWGWRFINLPSQFSPQILPNLLGNVSIFVFFMAWITKRSMLKYIWNNYFFLRLHVHFIYTCAVCLPSINKLFKFTDATHDRCKTPAFCMAKPTLFCWIVIVANEGLNTFRLAVHISKLWYIVLLVLVFMIQNLS